MQIHSSGQGLLSVEFLGKCLIIGEVAQAHDGSLGIAHSYIDAIADAGADAVKFQTHIASAESTAMEPWRTEFSRQDKTRYDYWRRMEFDASQWKGLKEHAEERGLAFISSPFSFEAFELLKELGVVAWKVASGEVGNPAFIQAIASTRKPVMLSSGMSDWRQLESAVRILRNAESPFALLQCTTAYPCPPEKVGLNVLSELRSRFQCPVGLSDHSGSIYAGLAAAVLGASIVEVHVTFSRQMFGPDVCASITCEELADLVKGIRLIERMMSSRVDKDSAAAELAEIQRIFSKSIVARTDLPSGTIIEERHLAYKKPGFGIPVERVGAILGRKTRVFIVKDSVLSEAQFEPLQVDTVSEIRHETTEMLRNGDIS